MWTLSSSLASRVLVESTPWHRCPACSPAIVGAYQARGAGFVREAASDPDVLERVSGLAALKESADCWLDDDDEEDDF